jgi:hypothetical protein
VDFLHWRFLRIETENTKEKSAGVKTIAYPVNQGLRIAFQSRINNADAHANGYTFIGIYENMNAKHCFTVRLENEYAKFG